MSAVTKKDFSKDKKFSYVLYDYQKIIVVNQFDTMDEALRFSAMSESRTNIEFYYDLEEEFYNTIINDELYPTLDYEYDYLLSVIEMISEKNDLNNQDEILLATICFMTMDYDIIETKNLPISV